MKRVYVFMIMVLLACVFVSCATTGSYRALSGNEKVLGSIQTRFSAGFQNNAGHIIDKAVYIALLEAARKEYQDPIDIGDIYWVRDDDDATKQIFAIGTVFQSPDGKYEFLYSDKVKTSSVCSESYMQPSGLVR